MKKIIPLICLCTFCTSVFSQYYYYYFDEKIPLTLNTGYIYIASYTTDAKQLRSAIGSDLELTSSGLDNARTAVEQTDIEKNMPDPLLKAEIRVKNTLTEEDYFALINRLKGLPCISYVAPSFSTAKNKKVDISHLFAVKLKSGEDTTTLREMAEKTGTKIIGRFKYLSHWYILSCDKNTTGNSMDMANQFYESGLFQTAEPDFFKCLTQVSCDNTDPLFPNQWNLQNTGQYSVVGLSSTAPQQGTPGVDINVCPAWGITTGSPSVITAIIDNGFQLDHPDLIANVPNSGFDVSCATISSGCVGSNVYTNPGNIPEHATELAGIVAAQQNSIGISGVAPTSSIISVSIDFGSSSVLTCAARGISLAWQSGNASVINCSWTTATVSSALTESIDSALSFGRGGLGTVVVLAAGNNAEQVEYPANLSIPGSSIAVPISVGAVDRCGAQSGLASVVPNSCEPWVAGLSFPGSDFGTDLAVVAPGTGINTCFLMGEGIGGGDYTNDASGTSDAAPHVAGIAVLILSVNPCLTAKQVTDIIESTCTMVDANTGPGTGLATYTTTTGRPNGQWSSLHGYGLVNAYAALSANTGYLQHSTETGTATRANLGDIYAGFSVNPNMMAPTGDYIISSGANIEIKSPTAIFLEPGSSAAYGSVMYAHIASFTGDCSDWTMFKTNALNNSGIQSSDISRDNIILSDLVTIYPNPFTNEISFNFSVSKDQTPVNILLTDIAGRVVYERKDFMDSGNHIYTVPVSSSASMYIAKVYIGNQSYIKKLVKYAAY